MKYFNKDIGSYGETLAEEHLKKLGYSILDKNFRCKTGEIDLIGKDTDYICFIEVKTRYTSIYGDPCEAITYSKMQKIYKSAQVYIMKSHLYNHNFRFDVVEILLNNKNDDYSIRVIKDAFQIS